MPFPLSSSPLIDAVPALPSLRSLGKGTNQAISGPITFGQVEFISGAYTLAPADKYLQINTHGVTVNLLATSGYLDNECIVIQDKTGSLAGFPVTVVPNGADHIDGAGSSFSFAVDSGVLVLRKTATGWWTQVTGSSLTLTIPQYATSSLPTPDGSARIAKLTDKALGFVFSNGASWRPETGLDVYVIEDFGGKADAGVTDNLIAWNAIMAVIQNSTSGYGVQSGPNGAIIRFGQGVYNFTDTPKLTVPGCIVEGGGGAYSGQRTLLTVPTGKRGFVVGDVNEDGGSGAGAVLRNFGLSGNGYLLGGTHANNNIDAWQATHAYSVDDIIQPAYTVNNGSKWNGYAWICTVSGTSGGSEPAWPISNTLSTYTETNPTQSDGGVTWQALQGHGLVVHGNCHCENLTVSAFAGDGFHIYGDTTNSNTDLSTFTNCNASSNSGSGFWTQGNDSAPSVYLMCNSLANFGYGFYDFSLEGNIYINCHTRNNGSGQWLSGNSPALHTFMSPTVPNDYLYMVTTAGGATGMTEPSWPTSIGATVTSGAVVLTCMRHYSGGGYYMRNSGMLTCYDEGGQQPNVLSTVNAWSRGGSHGSGFLVDPSAQYGRIESSRFNNNSMAVVSDNGDGHPVVTWLGSRNSNKIGWTVAPTTSGSPISGADLDLLFSSGNSSVNGWRFQTNAGANTAMVVTDGTESGTTAGTAQFPTGVWIGGPQGPAGGSFVSLSSHVTAPTGGQLGDIAISAQGAGAGIGTWHNIGSSVDDGSVPRWCIGTEAGAFHPIDISSTTTGSPYVCTRGDHNAVFHNRGASAKSAVSLRFADEFPYCREKFINDAATGMRIVSQHGSKIIFDNIDSGDAGYIETTQIGATITLESISGIYFVVAKTGSWNVNGVAAVQPGVEALLSSTVVDLSLTTKQNLYTVPTGKSLIVTKVITRAFSATITTALGGVGYDSGGSNVIPDTGMAGGTTTTYAIGQPSGPPTIGNAADVLGFKTTVTQATTTATIDIFGYLI